MACTTVDRFLFLLQERRKRRASILGFSGEECDTASQDFDSAARSPSGPVPKIRSSLRIASDIDNVSNLATHYLFSSSRPQNEIQNPYPNCFEGYPKLQR
jgi:hypothetical protein